MPPRSNRSLAVDRTTHPHGNCRSHCSLVCSNWLVTPAQEENRCHAVDQSCHNQRIWRRHPVFPRCHIHPVETDHPLLDACRNTCRHPATHWTQPDPIGNGSANETAESYLETA